MLGCAASTLRALVAIGRSILSYMMGLQEAIFGGGAQLADLGQSLARVQLICALFLPGFRQGAMHE
jgi:hypothetical protein